MNPSNFLDRLRQLITGKNGIRVVRPLNCIADIRTAAGLVIDASTTTPKVAASETNALVISCAASTTASGTFVFTVPKDYDKLYDELKINIMAVSGGTTNTPTLTATAYSKRAATALTAALTAVASAAINTSTAKAGEVTIDLSGNSLLPNDILTINLVAGAHTTDTVVMSNIEVQYRSTLVFYDSTTRG